MFSTIKRLLTYLSYYKKQFIVGAILLLLAAALELTSPLIAKQLIDRVMTPAVNSSNLDTMLLIQLLAGYLLVNLIGSLFRYISLLQLRKMSNSIVKKCGISFLTICTNYRFLTLTRSQQVKSLHESRMTPKSCGRIST